MEEDANSSPIVSAPPGPIAAVIGLFEMVLEVQDLAAAERFYREVIGLPVVARWSDERPATWLGLGCEGYLGLWPVESGGAVAIHGGRGGSHVHFALRLPFGSLDDTAARLEEAGYPTEAVDFGGGDRAIYLLDPDGNVVELTERTTLWDESPATEEPT
ncbi:MAG: VOC family protein [Chloroflexota bacterium]|nr:VOC family protein [Chloroflexota bacterium]